MDNNEQYKSLVDMGCNPTLCQAAVKSCKSQDIMVLLDWISANEDKEDHWKQWLSTYKEEPQPEKQEGGAHRIPIETLINMDHCQELIAKGHSKVVAQKSLLLTQNMGVRMAENWIEDHRYDPDFEEEAVVEGGNEEEKPQLTEQEKKDRLKELVEKSRAIKKEREEKDNLEREKQRMRSGKEMVEAKRIQEEQAAKRQVELDKIQKAKDEAYKQNLLEQMRRERNERLGIKDEGPSQKPAPKKKEEPKYTKLQQVELQCEQVKVGNHAYPERARVFFETATIYINNIIKNNGEEKFRKINKENKAFLSRVNEAFGGVETLLAVGYQDEGNLLVMHQFDLQELADMVKVIQRYLSFYV